MCLLSFLRHSRESFLFWGAEFLVFHKKKCSYVNLSENVQLLNFNILLKYTIFRCLCVIVLHTCCYMRNLIYVKFFVTVSWAESVLEIFAEEESFLLNQFREYECKIFLKSQIFSGQDVCQLKEDCSSQWRLRWVQNLCVLYLYIWSLIMLFWDSLSGSFFNEVPKWGLNTSKILRNVWMVFTPWNNFSGCASWIFIYEYIKNILKVIIINWL